RLHGRGLRGRRRGAFPRLAGDGPAPGARAGLVAILARPRNDRRGRRRGGKARRGSRRQAAQEQPGLRQQVLAAHLFFGVVRGPDERAGLDVPVAEADGVAFDLGELRRLVVAHDRQVVGARSQVLPDGQDVGARLANTAHRLAYLFGLLAEAHHDAALGEEAGRLRAVEQLQRALEARAGAHVAVQARHRLRVVVEDVGCGADHDLQGGRVTLEVRDEHLDRAARDALADLPDARGEDAGAAVTLIVAVDRRDHRVAQAHPGRRLRDPPGLAELG